MTAAFTCTVTPHSQLCNNGSIAVMLALDSTVMVAFTVLKQRHYCTASTAMTVMTVFTALKVATNAHPANNMTFLKRLINVCVNLQNVLIKPL